MKKLIPFILIIALVMSSCQQVDHQIENKDTEMRGIWISCYDHISAAGKTAEEYETETDGMFRTVSENGFNTAFVHLRAFSDSFYKSDIFPYSSYIAGVQGADLPFDPFEIIIKSAEKYGVDIHGWINPFRVATNPNPLLLDESNPAKKIIAEGNTNSEICILENGIYYNPSCTSNHKLVIDGVREILSKYDIGGIHIDDYFYPSTSETVDRIQFDTYRNSGGTLPLEEWRTVNVNAFVATLYSAVKSYGNEIIFSISPSADILKSRDELYADCELWLSAEGYADLIIPQIYYGFDHDKFAFKALLNQWSSFKRSNAVSLACGIAAYKCSEEDEYAGGGKNEWLERNDVLIRQAELIKNNPSFSGFVVFSYSDLIRDDASEEISKLKEFIYTEKKE